MRHAWAVFGRVGAVLVCACGLRCDRCSPTPDDSAVRPAAGTNPTSRVSSASQPHDAVVPSTASQPAGLTAEEDAAIPPGPPGRITVSFRDGVHVLCWDGTRDDTVAAYEVYRRCAAGAWVVIGRVPVRDERNEAICEWSDRSDLACEYTVAAVDRDGHVGPRSEVARSISSHGT